MIVIITIALMNVFSGGPIGSMGSSGPQELTVGQLLERVKEGKVEKVEWQESDIRGTFKDGGKFV
ncbi:MAG: ATP-dependent metallopeptidase FtsH/Yme1/Tma family protein, partial [Fimbriimonadaceae bacterium]